MQKDEVCVRLDELIREMGVQIKVCRRQHVHAHSGGSGSASAEAEHAAPGTSAHAPPLPLPLGTWPARFPPAQRSPIGQY